MKQADVLVSFCTRPGRGGEGGVGWGYLQAAVERARAQKRELFVILDRRDFDDVQRTLLPVDQVHLRPVDVPKIVGNRTGDRRTRGSYEAWALPARRELRSVCESVEVGNVHQVTFATASLSPVVIAGQGANTIWGPLMVPPLSGGAAQRSLLRVIQARSLHYLRRVNTVVATNGYTADFLERAGIATVIEPNIIVEPRDFAVEFEDDLVVVAGLLIGRKRPWLAIQMLRDTRLRELRLEFVGDGPLKSDLQQLAAELGVAHRVRFRGQIPREDVLRRIAAARALAHPSQREGAAWVVGEAAAMGTRPVVFAGSGCESTASMVGGVVCASGEGAAETLVHSLATGVRAAMDLGRPAPSARFASSRLSACLEQWWVRNE